MTALVICSLIGLILVVVLLAPFFVGDGGVLASASQIQSRERLSALRNAVLDRFLDDEAAHRAGDLNDRAWEKRRTFLANRYVDIVRRLDFIEGVSRAKEADD